MQLSLFPIVWDCKPDNKNDPVNWVELKTSATIENDRDMVKYERKLLKFWIQSFLLGVPKIIVGFRRKNGILQKIEELETNSIPSLVKKNKASWDGNVCINFTANFLDCKSFIICEIDLANIFEGLRIPSPRVVSGGFDEENDRLSSSYSNRKSRAMAIFYCQHS